MLAVAFLISGLGLGVAHSQAVSVLQPSVPEHERAHVNAAYRFLSWGALALGALGAGALINIFRTYQSAIVGRRDRGPPIPQVCFDAGVEVGHTGTTVTGQGSAFGWASRFSGRLFDRRQAADAPHNPECRVSCRT